MKLNRIYLLLLTPLFFSSCVTLYTPNTVHAPLLAEKGDFNGHLAAGSGTNVQAAYAVSDKVALMGNAHFVNGNKNETQFNGGSFKLKHSETMFEFAPGYLLHTNSENFRVEFYGGLGFGSVSDNKITSFSDSDAYRAAREAYPYTTANYTKIFIQPDIGYISTYFDISFALRMSLVNIANVHSTETYIDGSDYSLILAEPTFTVSGGPKYVRPFLQMGLTLPMGNASLLTAANVLIFNPINLSLGIRVPINKL